MDPVLRVMEAVHIYPAFASPHRDSYVYNYMLKYIVCIPDDEVYVASLIHKLALPSRLNHITAV